MRFSAIFVFSIAILLKHETNGVNILVVSTLPSPSHKIFHDAFISELVKKNYNVTLLTHDSLPHSSNYTQIILENVYQEIYEKFSDELKHLKEISTYQMNKLMSKSLIVTCEADFKTIGLKSLTDYPDNFRFDLIIWDINSGTCLYPLVKKFGNPPVIATNPYVNQPNLLRGVVQSHIPHMMFMYSDRMTIWERFHSNFYNVVAELLRYYYFRPEMIRLANEYFGNTKLTMDEFERNIQLVLANYNPILNYVEALPPNVISVGGLHISPKPLPEDFKNILDNAKNGVILLSFGTNIRSANLKLEKFDAIISAFSRIPMTIIWKFDKDDFENIPPNVHIKKWIPQIDILLHPNTKLFITHSGLLSTQEIFYAGVPAIAVPFFLDQYLNAGTIKERGIGEILDFEEIEEENFYNLIMKLVQDKTYAENAKRLSKLYHDFPQSPKDLAVWWVEYVLRHKSAAHFDLATRDMDFIRLYNLDLILGPFVIISLFIMICVKCVQCCRSNRKQKIKQS